MCRFLLEVPKFQLFRPFRGPHGGGLRPPPCGPQFSNYFHISRTASLGNGLQFAFWIWLNLSHVSKAPWSHNLAVVRLDRLILSVLRGVWKLANIVLEKAWHLDSRLVSCVEGTMSWGGMNQKNLKYLSAV